jgi:F-type H+-transporting ATPase subunit b
LFNAFTQFGDGSSGFGALGISGSALLIQLVTFILAFFILRRFAFKPILKVLNDRREAINKGINLGDEMQKQQKKLDETVTKSLREARNQADAIMAEAQDAARAAARDNEEKSRLKADAIIKEAEERIEQEAMRVRHELEKELVGLVSSATEVIIDEKVDATKDAKLIDRALKGQKA